MPRQGSPGASAEVIGKRVAVFRKGKGHPDLSFRELRIFDQTECNDVTVALGRVLHLGKGLQYLFFLHFYLTMVISSSSHPAPPNLSIMSRT